MAAQQSWKQIYFYILEKIYVIFMQNNFDFLLSYSVGLINKILSWGAFVPLSRLTFGAYLVHPLILEIYYNSLQAVRHYTDMSIVSI